jgi:hypothetical protein
MDWDACKAGLVPALPNNIIVSKHAIQRAQERGIQLSDLYHPTGRHGSGKPIMVGNTVVTAVVNLPNRRPVDVASTELQEKQVNVKVKVKVKTTE